MKHQCRECKRLNPEEAVFCFYDGVALENGRSAAEGASIDFATWAFPMPFVFPSGARCANFLQLALACHKDPHGTADLLQKGFLGSFFGSLGRVDLAMAAAAAAKAPDADRAVDDLLDKLPGSPLRAAQLEVDPVELNLGVVQVGEDRQFEVQLTNKGDRLITGKVSVEGCPWLVVGDSNTSEKLFQFFENATIPVHIRGKLLRANNKPQVGEITVESNGGNFIVGLQLTAPVKPFTQGVLSGATSPRQLAEKAKANPKDAAVLLENGAVAAWYAANGWTYPVHGPTATGIAAVQQFFETLGLVKPPKVELSEKAVMLNGKPGERLEHTINVVTQEKRAAVAYAVSDQPWLTIGKTTFKGQTASIPLVVESVPGEPKQTLKATAKVVGNGNQRFEVPVSLVIGDGPVISSPHRQTTPMSLVPTLALADDLPEVLPVAVNEPSPSASAPAPIPITATAPTPPPVIPIPEGTAPAGGPAPARKPGDRKELLIRLLPVGIVLLGLLTALAHDIFFKEKSEEPLPEIDWANPRVHVQFHDKPGNIVNAPTMRFGLGVPDPRDKSKFKTRLTFDDLGQTSNVCVRVDRTTEYLWGLGPGTWQQPVKQPLGQDRETKHDLIGAKAIWVQNAPKIRITQYVEIVPGGLSEDGKKRLLDTCLVYYEIVNDDAIAHSVGLRFMLDTFIGNNDAVPFTIAGAKELCNTMKTFDKPEDVPDYISALEREDLKDPGTVAHLSLKYGGGLEAPSRVTLGAWPAASLRKEAPQVATQLQMQNTLWEVPVLPMGLAKSAENPKGDSAVTMYWAEKELLPNASRKVGFAYGLGTVTGDKGTGQLGMTAGGELVEEKEFTLTAYVKNPARGETIHLKLPGGLKLVAGSEKENVPPIPAGSSSPYSPVTWRVKAVRAGVQRVTVSLGSGPTLQHRLVITKAGLFR